MLLALAALVASPPERDEDAADAGQVGPGYVLLPAAGRSRGEEHGDDGSLRAHGLPEREAPHGPAPGQLPQDRHDARALERGRRLQARAAPRRRWRRRCATRARARARRSPPGDPTLPPLRFKITRITGSKLLKGYLAVRVRVTGTVKGKHVDSTSYAVYQRLGNVLSGTYSFGPNTKAQLTFVLHAAQQSAANLRRGQRSGGPDRLDPRSLALPFRPWKGRSSSSDVSGRRRRHRAGRRRGDLDRRRRRESQRLVLRVDRSVPVPRARLRLRRDVHDGGASRARLAGARRPEPAAPRGSARRRSGATRAS